MWGGIPQAAADLAGSAWPLLSALTPADGEKDGNTGGRLVVHGLPYVTFWQAADLMGLAAAGTRENLDRLLRRRILRRGLVLCCGRCNWLGWYPLGSLGQDFECPRCTHGNIIEQQLWRDPLEEPAWYYDLDHAVREALRLNGRIPILAADSLRQAYTDAFSFTLDFEMIKPGDPKPTVEIDLAVTGNGQIILCEAKAASVLATSARDEQRDTAKLIGACQALTADALCLATGQASWSARTRSAVQAACDSAGVRTLWLEGLGSDRPAVAAPGTSRSPGRAAAPCAPHDPAIAVITGRLEPSVRLPRPGAARLWAAPICARAGPGSAGQNGGRERWSYSCQPCLVRIVASIVTYMSILTSASILKVPAPTGAPGSSARWAALQVVQKSPWAMPLRRPSR